VQVGLAIVQTGRERLIQALPAFRGIVAAQRQRFGEPDAAC